MRKIRSFILCLFTLMHVIGILHAQQIATPRFTLNFDKKPLLEVLQAIEQECKVSFSYSSRKIPTDELVTLKASQLPLDDVLKMLFEELPISYVKVESKIVLQKAKPKKVQQVADEGEQKQTNKRYTLNGYIRDGEDGEVLIGATVFIPELSIGAMTNAYGFFSLSMEEGDYNVQVNYLGYIVTNRQIRLLSDQSLDVKLKRDIEVLQEIVIRPSDTIQHIENLNFEQPTLKAEVMQNQPAFMGEYDVIKSITTLPGIKLYSDGSTFFHVRGGHRDQNQILLDEAPIYNPSHLLGLFSTFIPETVKDMKIYKGDLPVMYGGRVSSVMDVKTNDGSLKNFGLRGSVGLMSARIAIDGPIKRDKASFFTSLRTSHIKRYLQKIDPEVKDLYFYDFNAKINLTINEKNRLFISTYFGEDKYIRGESGISWNNNALALRWNRVFNQKLFMNMTAYTSLYDYKLYESVSKDNKWISHIANASIKADFSWYTSPGTTIVFGSKVSGHNFNPGNYENAKGERPEGISFVPKKNATETLLYAGANVRLHPKWMLSTGLRFTSWMNTGKTIEYTFGDNYQVVDSVIYEDRENYHTYHHLEPRFDLVYGPNDLSSFRLNYSRNTQHINVISNSISPFNNLEVWLPASPNIKPQLADQVLLHYSRLMRRGQYSLSVEGYYKWLKNQLDYENQAALLLNPYFEGQLRSGKGKNYGVEILLQKNTGKLSGYLGYTWARSFRQIEGINNGKAYPTLWDRPHYMTTNVIFKMNRRLTLSGAFQIGSGGVFTSPVSFYYYQNKSLPLYSEKNNDRLPVYHRFDIDLKFELNRRAESRFKHYITLSLFNAYAHKNAVYQNFNKSNLDGTDIMVPANVAQVPEMTPTRAYLYSLVPGLSYNFHL